jgi:hypothetical protein
VRNEGSARPFVEEIRKGYPLDKTNVFVMNDLRSYGNLYGMNFYLGNCFRDFEFEQPQSGYFLAIEKDFPKIVQKYQGKYTFTTLRTSDKIISDVRGKIILSRFTRDNP